MSGECGEHCLGCICTRYKYNIFHDLIKDLPKGKIEIVPDNPEDKNMAIQYKNIVRRSFKDLQDTLINGMISAYENCPDAENKTFEEIAEWAGRHVLITENEEK